MKNNNYFIVFFALISSFLLTNCASSEKTTEVSQIRYGYKQLKLLDLDQMSALLQRKVKESKELNGAVEPLFEGMLITYGRPNEDGMIDKVLPIIRYPLEDMGQWLPSLEQLTDHAINAMKSSEVPASDQVTYGTVLENLVSELKPDFIKQYESPGLESNLIERIARAEVQYSDRARSERKLNLMKSGLSPSILAQNLLDRRTAYIEQKKKEQKKKK